MGVISEDVVEALRNELRDILELVTDKVKVSRLKAPQGSLCLWRFDVNAPTHYLINNSDMRPKATNQMTFFVDVKDGFPRTKPHVYYDPNFYLASVNVFRDGSQCIDEWHYDEEHAGNNSSLLNTVRKTIRDIIHDPTVARFDSMANHNMKAWQEENIKNGNFPTCKLNYVFKMSEGATGRPVPPPVPTVPANRTKPMPPSVPTRRMTPPPPVPTPR